MRVGPRHTEYASTHGMISETTTTHDASSKKSRKSHPANVAAPSLANDAGPSQPMTEKTTASTTQTTIASQRQRQSRSGNRIQTGAKTAGMTSKAMNATSHHTEEFGRLSWPAKYAARTAATTPSAARRRRVNREVAPPTTGREP